MQSSTIDWLTNFPTVKVTICGYVLTCKKCSDYPSVQSLLKGYTLIADFDELRCEAEKDVQVQLSSDLRKSLTFDCHRTAIIGATVASTIAVVTTVCVGITVLRYKRKIKRREDRMASAVANLHVNQGNGFAVYLIYSSVDEVFVRSAVFLPLNEKLKQVTGVERDLVCIGDEQFRVG
ncbi:hypothetical protein DPMN_148781 [Dreissena polymorpha]|uniref:Uncharacterized protein n=1 Tax=Dreissena polymorpha TaxID=45954 RepID=A0A9D4FAL2_DREPO|nr:hypothetical protein DPMN_148781 [Dreissena polymorpha]